MHVLYNGGCRNIEVHNNNNSPHLHAYIKFGHAGCLQLWENSQPGNHLRRTPNPFFKAVQVSLFCVTSKIEINVSGPVLEPNAFCGINS